MNIFLIKLYLLKRSFFVKILVKIDKTVQIVDCELVHANVWLVIGERFSLKTEETQQQWP